jgi:hypothetical protein
MVGWGCIASRVDILIFLFEILGFVCASVD